MKNILVFMACFVAMAFAGEKIAVAVSLQPYANIVKSIAGDDFEIVAMLSPGADPHTYEPKPDVLKAFAKAKVYFSDGSGMDKAWLPRFKGVNKNVKIIDVSNGISWLKEEHEEHHEVHGRHHEHHHDHGDIDPHVWTSPKQVLHVALNIRSALTDLNPDRDTEYEKNYLNFVERVTEVSMNLEKAVEKLPKSKRSFIVFHPSYGYLARDYGLTQLTIEVNGKEPKPKDLKYLIEEGKEHDVHLVFVQPQFSKRAAETIATELNATVEETDPLAYDFLQNTLKLIESILKAATK